MEKNTIMAMTIAAVVSIIMIGLTRVPAYIDAMNNWLFMIMLLFFMTAVFGFGLDLLFYKKKGSK